MFFHPELLSKRESGFGLLWLAATLGPKSSFKKLPRRSVQTADIPQLCDLISHPSEPLALRLSSNLMIGVARVYKIKHEIFMGDVTNCFSLLKKAVQDLNSLGALSETQLQMGQPTIRSDALNLTIDPTISVAFELDILDHTWQDFSNLSFQRKALGERDEDDDVECDDDGEFTLGNKSKNRKSKVKSKPSLENSEVGRAATHTLDEHHAHILSASFDANRSFLADFGFDPSSSQIDPDNRLGSFTLGNDFFDPNEQLDLGLGDFDDGLARGFGDGVSDRDAGVFGPDFQMMDDGGTMNFGFDDFGLASEGKQESILGRKRPFSEVDQENIMPPILAGHITPRSGITQQSARFSFADEAYGNADIAEVDIPDLIPDEGTPEVKKTRRTKLIIDHRTELTDDELKAARAKYVQEQSTIREETEKKRLEKQGLKALEDLLWGVPDSITAPELVQFWTDTFKASVDARMPKGRTEAIDVCQRDHENAIDPSQDAYNYGNAEGMGGDYDFGAMQGDYDGSVQYDNPSRMRSSEEPERARDAPGRLSPNLAFDTDVLNPSSGTQRSTFFPWDHAAGSSSSVGAPFGSIAGKGSDHISLDKADIRLQLPPSRPGSRRGSIMTPPGRSGAFDSSLSPISGNILSITGGEDFRFDGESTLCVSQEWILTPDIVPEYEAAGTKDDTQPGQDTLVTLEKASFNFFEYCKMQAQALPGRQNSLSFDDVAPRHTSSRRVAAAAFYHCLALATKDLMAVKQNDAYGPLTLKLL